MVELAIYGSSGQRLVLNAINVNDTNGNGGNSRLAEAVSALPRVSLHESFRLSVAALIKTFRDGQPAPTTGER